MKSYLSYLLWLKRYLGFKSRRRSLRQHLAMRGELKIAQDQVVLKSNADFWKEFEADFRKNKVID
jgi:hypothetical protein